MGCANSMRMNIEEFLFFLVVKKILVEGIFIHETLSK